MFCQLKWELENIKKEENLYFVLSPGFQYHHESFPGIVQYDTWKTLRTESADSLSTTSKLDQSINCRILGEKIKKIFGN